MLFVKFCEKLHNYTYICQYIHYKSELCIAGGMVTNGRCKLIHVIWLQFVKNYVSIHVYANIFTIN